MSSQGFYVLCGHYSPCGMSGHFVYLTLSRACLGTVCFGKKFVKVEGGVVVVVILFLSSGDARMHN